MLLGLNALLLSQEGEGFLHSFSRKRDKRHKHLIDNNINSRFIVKEGIVRIYKCLLHNGIVCLYHINVPVQHLMAT